jgi:site-specific DNA recombinase
VIKFKLEEIEKDRDESLVVLRQKVLAINTKVSHIQTLLADGKLSIDNYNDMKQNFEKERVELQKSLEDAKSIRTLFDQFITEGINILTNTAEFYKRSDIEMKQRLSSTLFPNGIIFQEGEVRTPKINEALNWILSNSNENRRQQKKIEEHILPCSSMVEPKQHKSNSQIFFQDLDSLACLIDEKAI